MIRHSYIQKGAFALAIVVILWGCISLPSYVHTRNPVLKVQKAYLTNVSVGKGEQLLFSIMDVDGNEYMASYSLSDVERLKSGCPSLSTVKLVELMKTYYSKNFVEITMNTRWFDNVTKVHITDKIINFHCHA